MPAPSITLTFKKITGEVGPYRGRWEDHPRRGVDGHRFYYLGKRGDRRTVKVEQYFANELAARQAVGTWEAAMGREVTIVSEIDAASWRVFIFAVTAPVPQRIGSTLANVTYRAEATLEIVRTA